MKIIAERKTSSVYVLYGILLLVCSAFVRPIPDNGYESKQSIVEFSSLDGLKITGDYYDVKRSKKLVVLCHQAGWSRGEYQEIIKELVLLGYSCLAIDQRSGGKVNGVINETAKRAREEKKPTTYLDAEQDIIAAVRWGSKKKESIILWGSSYSSSLVLKVAAEESSVIKVLSFSPGEYFGNKLQLKSTIDELTKPVFITCAKSEIERTEPIFNVIPSKNKTFFKPTTKGNHGSRALWSKFDDHESYWKAVKTFLKKK